MKICSLCASRGLQQVQAVGLGLAQCLLVTVDDLAIVIFHPAQGDEAAPLDLGSAEIAGDLELLNIDIKAGLGIALRERLPSATWRRHAAARV